MVDKSSRDARHEKMYTAWANSCLKDSPVRITDIRKDLVDGVTLIKLLTALTDNKDKIKALKYAENPKNQFQVNINLNLAMKFMKEVDKVHIVFIDANDTLALMWTLILHYHYGSTINDIVEAKKLLLGWLKALLPERNITNFNKDWMDGWNLIALINKFLPDQIGKNWNDKSDIERVAEVLKVADERLGIPQIIDASDICTEQHDDRSIVSYIIYFCNKDSVGQNTLMKWIQETIPECGISNFTTDWSDGTALGSLAHAVSGGNFPQHKEMSPSDPIANFTSSIQFAATLGIPEIVTPQELTDPNLDPLTLVTYLTYFQSAQVPSIDSVPVVPVVEEIADYVVEDVVEGGMEITMEITASGPGISGGLALEEETQFVLSGLTQAVSVNVNITDSHGSVVTHSKSELQDGQCTISYRCVSTEGYTIEVLANEVHIKGSPFKPVFIHHSRLQCKGEGLQQCVVGKETEFTVNCSSDLLQVEIQGPTTIVNANIIPSINNMSTVRYSPVEVGLHKINVQVMSHHIQGSPFSCNGINPNKCIIDSLPSSALINHPVSFTACTAGAGQADLVINILGPDKNFVPFSSSSDASNSRCDCSFVPTMTGLYSIACEWGGIKVSETHMSVASCRVRSGLIGNLRLLKEASFMIEMADGEGGQLKATCDDCQCDIHLVKEGNYKISFVPNKVGSLIVNATYAGSQIPDLPLHLSVNDPSKCIIDVESIQNEVHKVDHPVDIMFSTRDAGNGEVIATINGSIVKCHRDAYGDDLIRFIPKYEGQYDVSISFDGVEITQSPFKINVIPDNANADKEARRTLLTLATFGVVYYLFLMIHEAI